MKRVLLWFCYLALVAVACAANCIAYEKEIQYAKEEIAEENAKQIQQIKEEIRAEYETAQPFGAMGNNFTDAVEEMLYNGEFQPCYAITDAGLSEDLQAFAYYMAKQYDIEYEYVLAIMYTESGFGKGSSNVMQVMPICMEAVQKYIDVNDMSNPYQSIYAGIFYLRSLFNKYSDPTIVAMAYNMGEGGAKRLWNQGIHSTYYTDKVNKHYSWIKGMLEEGGDRN